MTARERTFTLLWCLAYLASIAYAQPGQTPAESRSPAVQWVTREVQAPRVSFHTFDSASAKAKVSYHLYTPAAYGREPERRFPVVYWLHGSGGGLAGIPQVARHFDEAIEAGNTPPCLVMFVNGIVGGFEGMYVDWKDGTAPLETMIVKDLVPHIDTTLRTVATREGRMLDGFSMGGYGAARLGFKFPEMFRAVSIVGAGPMQAELIQAPRAGRERASEVLAKVYGGDQAYFRSVSPRTLAEQNAETITKSSLVRMVIGDKDETFENNRLFHEHLDALNIPHTWTVLRGVEHSPMDVLTAMGADNWAFYRAAFDPAEVRTAAEEFVETVHGLTVDGRERSFIVQAPREPRGPLPVVFVFHGGGGRGENMARNGFRKMVARENFIAVYPSGWRGNWNDGRDAARIEAQQKGVDDVKFVRAIIDDLTTRHTIDRARVFATGVSNGGIFCHYLAANAADIFAAIAPMIGGLAEPIAPSFKPSHPISLLVIQGDLDLLVPIEGGPVARSDRGGRVVATEQMLALYAAHNAIVGAPVEERLPDVDEDDGCRTVIRRYPPGQDGATIEYWLVEGGGHTVPGSREGRAAREGRAGRTSRDFDALEVVWNFLREVPSRHRVPAEAPATLGAAREAAEVAGLNPDILDRLDVEMQEAVANREVAGVVGLVHRNGHRGYFKAFGHQDIEAGTPMPTDAIFRLQSMSKPVVTVAALTLLDEGRFTLDEPISKHLPEWAEPKVLEDGKLVPARHAITPRMLMSHSSGLYYGNLPGAPRDGGVTRDDRTTLESYSKDLAVRPLKFHPGEGYSYGTSIDVLGRYVEAVAGKPLDEVLRERIFAPLKMNDTDFWVPESKASRIAQLYRQVRPGELARGREASQLTTKPSLFMGGQGLCSTAEDYERFCRMILNRGELDGVRVLKPETVDLMFQNHLKTDGQRYGLGGAVDERGGYSWGGANGTQFWIDRTNKMFAIFMVQTQRYRAPTYNTFRRLVNEAAGVTSRGGGLDGPLGDQPAGEAPERGAEPAAGARPRQAFNRLDADGTGSLSRQEYNGSPLADRADFSTADANGDGVVSFEEALAVLRRR